ncbi:unnamed protein product [Meganyctiphanes norvegica]|uniref:C-type lectin domain-containing protein n=1 Tax=Meganyctiphanes norvegica TaxID=48144 RepID=A0AAV2QXQ8_MEGNR
MRKKDRCKGEIRFFQTNCIDECECCMGSKEQVSGHNIEIVRRRRDWQGARDECRDKGGDLFVPKSVGDLLYQLRKNQMSTHKLWIGISDTKRPGQFRGIQGNRIREGWQNREPRAHEVGDDCVVVQHRSDAKRGMRTRRCREEHFFICDLSNEYRSDHTVRY